MLKGANALLTRKRARAISLPPSLTYADVCRLKVANALLTLNPRKRLAAKEVLELALFQDDKDKQATYSGSIQALFRLYSGSIQAVSRPY